MLQSQPALTEDDLPYSDDQPVDNELQLLLPVLLRATLAMLWADRQDWFMGVNIGLYYDTQQPAIGPDAFLSLGVPRYKREQGRLSYVVEQEGVMPQWVLEIVSQKRGGEYGEKYQKYAEIGVPYYTIYNPNHWRRDRHEPFEVYRLENGQYIRQQGNPVWMPELGLGIGIERGRHEGLEREWLYWYDESGHKYPAPDKLLEQERQIRENLEHQYQQEQALRLQAEQQAKALIQRQLARWVGPVPDALWNQVEQLTVIQLEALGEALLDFKALADLQDWLEQTQSEVNPV
ncbi:MAG: DUF4351 domain-containing protein [Elainella sp.]